MIARPFAYLSAALFAAIIVMSWFLYSYREEIRSLALDYASASANRETCRAMLAEQNAELERMRHEKPAPRTITRAEYRDNVVVRYVDRNISQEECHETSAHIDAARRLFP
jgi:hypothetical protein